jgi:hypothetical protein
MGRAIAFQGVNQYESAMKDWIEVGNFNVAHQILMKNIVPLYFSMQGLDLSKRPLQLMMNHKEGLRDILTRLQ